MKRLIWLVLAVLMISGVARAELIDRGNGLIYDTVLDITWLQDASLGTGPGLRPWNNAVNWADGLVYQGFDDWRLPSMSVSGGLPTGTASSIINCVTASEMDCRDNELGYMYYYNLTPDGDTSPTNFQTDLRGIQGLIQNIQTHYWSGTTAPDPDPLSPGNAWLINFFGKQQFSCVCDLSPFGWAVRDGDVVPAPVQVMIDIKPGSDPNAINPKSKGVISVAILGSIEFDAMQVDSSTVVFGPDEASPVHDGHVEDVNGDGFADMVFHFKARDTGVACGDTDATLTGETFAGDSITGTDAVKTAGCK